jgi:hypothetical protein
MNNKMRRNSNRQPSPKEKPIISDGIIASIIMRTGDSRTVQEDIDRLAAGPNGPEIVRYLTIGADQAEKQAMTEQAMTPAELYNKGAADLAATILTIETRDALGSLVRDMEELGPPESHG